MYTNPILRQFALKEAILRVSILEGNISDIFP